MLKQGEICIFMSTIYTTSKEKKTNLDKLRQTFYKLKKTISRKKKTNLDKLMENKNDLKEKKNNLKDKKKDWNRNFQDKKKDFTKKKKIIWEKKYKNPQPCIHISHRDGAKNLSNWNEKAQTDETNEG